MPQADSARPQADPLPVVGALPKPVLPRGLALAALTVLVLYVATQAPALYREWLDLQSEMTGVRTSEVVGYPGIQPNYSYAQRPSDWYQVDGEKVRLWCGWRHGKGHQWFGAALGDVERARLSLPQGRDVNQAIDRPVVESHGGAIWGRIPEDSRVVAGELAGVHTAYPMVVLQRVFVINDEIRDRPFLVTFNPLGDDGTAVTVYDPVVDGERLSMGVSGYLHDDAPMLYDRGTQSLWVRGERSLRAIAGAHRGRKLPEVARPVPVTWDRWRDEHPAGRLVVGAERSPATRY